MESKEGMFFKRVKSTSSEGFTPLGTENTNVEFVRMKTFWVFYISLILSTRFITGAFFEDRIAWSVVSFIHNTCSFVLLHWNKGTINAFDWGIFDTQTFWEQIDGGMQDTTPRKLFTLIPICVFLAASYSSQWDKSILVVNFLGLMLALIPKHGDMMGIRIAGINMWPSKVRWNILIILDIFFVEKDYNFKSSKVAEAFWKVLGS